MPLKYSKADIKLLAFLVYVLPWPHGCEIWATTAAAQSGIVSSGTRVVFFKVWTQENRGSRRSAIALHDTNN